jgi:AraC-like DNA-binding protein
MLVYKQRLDQIMQSRKEYLRLDLTLPRLAESVGCSVNNLSQVINSGFGTSFFDYLNRYRIEHAKNLLENSDTQSSAILTIAFTVGFNSNSAFYSAFKKYAGMTPAQYRQRYVNSHH